MLPRRSFLLRPLRFACAIGVALVAVSVGSAAWAEKRVALVVGNAAYRFADKLANPINDSRAMRASLTKLGFEVVYGEDLDQHDLNRTIGDFAAAVDGADVAIVYFAGHGATFDDKPYLVPVDAKFTSLANIAYQLVPVETFIGELRRANGIRIAILDACRDDKAEIELKRLATRGIGEPSKGLARVRDAEGLIIAYGTAHNATAADGDPNGDSPFTAAIVRNIGTPNLDVTDLFRKVAREVIATTGGRQKPEISLSLFDPYFLAGKVEVAALTPPDRQKLLGSGRQAAEECGRRVPDLLAPKRSDPLAVAACEKAVAENAADADSASRLGHAYMDAKRYDVAYATLMRAADAGSSEAMVLLGSLTMEGQGTVKSVPQALTWYAKASARGNKMGELFTGVIFATGATLPKDEQRGVKIVTGLADGGFAPAMLMLSAGYSFGVGVAKDDRLSLHWLQKAADTHFQMAVMSLANAREQGQNGAAKDVAAAAALYREAAEAGNIDAMKKLGRLYEIGRGVRRSTLEASDWFRRAADTGGDATMVEIGAMFENGSEGLSKDSSRAADWYRQAAEGGGRKGILALARLYDDKDAAVHDEKEASRWYLKAAAGGDLSSMVVTGSRYFKSVGASPSEGQGEYWFSKAAERGGLPIIRTIASLYESGRAHFYDDGSGFSFSIDEFPVDKPRAVEWRRRAVEKGGEASDMVDLAKLYAGEDQALHDDAEANLWFRKAAEGGDLTAMKDLAGRLAKGVGSAPDLPAADSWFAKAADKGGPKVMNDIGELFGKSSGNEFDLGFGSDFPIDKVRAAAWYQKAAEAGDLAGMENLALAYNAGEGLNQNTELAWRWLRKAAEAGRVSSMNAMAEAYHAGAGIPRDETQATDWFRKAAEKGDRDSMRNLARRLELGQGIAKDTTQAIDWYAMAAEAGDEASRNMLGIIYEFGRGTAKDAAKAVAFYQKAAEGYDKDAMYNLGRCYRDGKGVARSLDLAKGWFEKASNRGNEKAAKALELLAKSP